MKPVLFLFFLLIVSSLFPIDIGITVLDVNTGKPSDEIVNILVNHFREMDTANSHDIRQLNVEVRNMIEASVVSVEQGLPILLFGTYKLTDKLIEISIQVYEQSSNTVIDTQIIKYYQKDQVVELEYLAKKLFSSFFPKEDKLIEKPEGSKDLFLCFNLFKPGTTGDYLTILNGIVGIEFAPSLDLDLYAVWNNYDIITQMQFPISYSLYINTPEMVNMFRHRIDIAVQYYMGLRLEDDSSIGLDTGVGLNSDIVAQSQIYGGSRVLFFANLYTNHEVVYKLRFDDNSWGLDFSGGLDIVYTDPVEITYRVGISFVYKVEI